VGVEPFAHADFGDIALRVENHLPFGQIEVERRARRARLGEQGPAAPEVAERRQHVGVPAFVGRVGIIGRLRAFIGDVGAQPHQRAGETP